VNRFDILSARGRAGIGRADNVISIRRTRRRLVRKTKYDTLSVVSTMTHPGVDPVTIPISQAFVVTPEVGDYIKIDYELLRITDISNYPTTLVASRAHSGTSKNSHPADAIIYSNIKQDLSWYDTSSTVSGIPVHHSIDPVAVRLSQAFMNVPTVGDYTKIDAEILQITNLSTYPASIRASRAHFGTAKVGHPPGSLIYSDQSQVITWYDSGWTLTSIPDQVFSTANTTGWSSPLTYKGPSNITIYPGDIIKINSEEIRINDSSITGNRRLEVILGGRGSNGTTSAAHQADDLVYVNHS